MQVYNMFFTVKSIRSFSFYISNQMSRMLFLSFAIETLGRRRLSRIPKVIDNRNKIIKTN